MSKKSCLFVYREYTMKLVHDFPDIQYYCTIDYLVLLLLHEEAFLWIPDLNRGGFCCQLSSRVIHQLLYFGGQESVDHKHQGLRIFAKVKFLLPGLSKLEPE